MENRQYGTEIENEIHDLLSNSFGKVYDALELMSKRDPNYEAVDDLLTQLMNVKNDIWRSMKYQD